MKYKFVAFIVFWIIGAIFYWFDFMIPAYIFLTFASLCMGDILIEWDDKRWWKKKLKKVIENEI